MMDALRITVTYVVQFPMPDDRGIDEWFTPKAIMKETRDILLSAGVPVGVFDVYVLGYHKMLVGNSFVVHRLLRMPIERAILSGVYVAVGVPRGALHGVECLIVPVDMSLERNDLLSRLRAVARERNRSPSPRRRAYSEGELGRLKQREQELERQVELIQHELELVRARITEVALGMKPPLFS